MNLLLKQPIGLVSVEINNLEYLPLFYLFPKEVLERACPLLADMPRSLHGILKDSDWVDRISGDYFLLAISDLTAAFVWPALGVRAYMECYSGHDPIWQLAHASSLWLNAFEKIGGITIPYLAQNIKLEMPYLTNEEAQMLFLRIGEKGIEEHELQPVIDTVNQMRCAEDFDARGSHAKTDFNRKWNHTRWRYKTVSLDQLVDQYGGDSRDDAIDAVLHDRVSDDAASFEDTVCAKLDTERFYNSLSERDREMLTMRADGYTYQEIADKLGYKTHSAVMKRIKRLGEGYLDFTDEQQGLRAYFMED